MNSDAFSCCWRFHEHSLSLYYNTQDSSSLFPCLNMAYTTEYSYVIWKCNFFPLQGCNRSAMFSLDGFAEATWIPICAIGSTNRPTTTYVGETDPPRGAAASGLFLHNHNFVNVNNG